ncbi:hypothetical protein SORBI_3001G268000 [Sorghum bicolor]|uniref:Uncharacterized protein n=1 Tax=Sorghum bicolor TaxID=4558 RepID=A0A1B6QLA3_SORBI|nr:hypothetical protein SORBI_3001G268000 [Sorghum bicolor]
MVCLLLRTNKTALWSYPQTLASFSPDAHTASSRRSSWPNAGAVACATEKVRALLHHPRRCSRAASGNMAGADNARTRGGNPRRWRSLLLRRRGRTRHENR